MSIPYQPPISNTRQMKQNNLNISTANHKQTCLSQQPISYSNPAPPPDPFFKPQDISAKSSTTKSANFKTIQPQETRNFNHTTYNTTRANPPQTQLTTKPQEIKSDRPTHDQSGEYAPHGNITGQYSSKGNIPPKQKSETDEIDPQQVVPQDTVPFQPQQVAPQDAVPFKFSLGRPALDSQASFPQMSLNPPEDIMDKGVPFFPRLKTNNEKRPVKARKHTRHFSFLKGAPAKQVKTEELSQDDVVIAVMGPTGSGKSTFIKLATGFETGVGHTLESCTSEINIVKLSVPELADGDIVFVDTPGFDDTHRSDTDILKTVADWLATTYKHKILLSGLLYFHRISDNRMAGTPLKNLRMFEELCGKNAFQNVILTTTMWDEVDDEMGNLREQELKLKYWRSMLDRGSTTSRFLHTRKSALHLIEPLIDAANKKSSVLLQQELVDMRTQLPATSAGLRLYSEMEILVKRRQEMLVQIRNAMKSSNEDKTTIPALQDEYQKIRIQLENTIADMQKLKLPLGKRLLQTTRKWFPSRFRFSY